MTDPFVESPVSHPPFVYSSEVAYGCTFCGECCRERWRVPLDEPTCQSLKQRDWNITALRDRARQDPNFFAESIPTLSTRMAFRNEQGQCILLGQDGLCQAHHHFGAKAKGVVCRLFPYLFVEAPEGIYVGYSFCCRPVRKPQELKTATNILKESVEDTWQEAKNFFPGIHYQKATPRVALGWNIDIPWESYLLLEQGLLTVLSRQGAPFRYLLAAGYYYLNLIGLFLKEFPDRSMEQIHQRVSHFVEAMSKENFERVDRMARRGKARMGLRRYVMSMMLGLHQAGMKARDLRDSGKGRGEISRLSLMRAFFGHFGGRSLGTTLPQELLSEMAGRYLRHVIWRKGLALGSSLYRLGGLCREYAMLLVMFSLIEYYAGVFASGQLGAEEAICEAIRVVERDFVLHAGKDETGPAEQDRDGYDLFLSLFDSLVHSKSFAPSILRL